MLDWFPDRRGLASGLVIAGFGSGALAFTPLVQNLCRRWADSTKVYYSTCSGQACYNSILSWI